jgi:Glycosyl transferase family 2
MKLVMTLLVRDEDDIVSANIDFHLKRGVDFIIAMDNLSEDRTPQILQRYERQGLLCYMYQPEDNYAQHRWVTQMARLASTEFGADWVINSDADEFWWPQHGDLKEVLSEVDPSGVAVSVERTNFLPRARALNDFFADAMTVRDRRSLSDLGTPLRDKVCHRAFPDIDVRQGNHGVSRDGRTLPTVSAPITILHFPIRSYEQLANKISKGGAAYARNSHLPPEIGGTWRRLYEVWQRGELEARYREWVLDEKAIEDGLRDGRLVFDDRLKRFLADVVWRRPETA